MKIDINKEIDKYFKKKEWNYIIYDIYTIGMGKEVRLFMYDLQNNTWKGTALTYYRSIGYDQTGFSAYGNWTYDQAKKEFMLFIDNTSYKLFFHQDYPNKHEYKINPKESLNNPYLIDVKDKGYIGQGKNIKVKNLIYNKLSKNENKYINLLILYVKKKFKVSLSKDEGIELFILLKHHANDWKRSGIKQTPELEIAVMKDYIDDLMRKYWSKEKKSDYQLSYTKYAKNPSDLSGKEIVFPEGTKFYVPVRNKKGKTVWYHDLTLKQALSTQAWAIKGGFEDGHKIYYGTSLQGEFKGSFYSRGDELLKHNPNISRKELETKMKIVRDNPNAPAIDLWEKERAEAEKLPNGILVMRYDSASNLPTDGPSRASLKMWLPKAYKPFVNYYYTGRNIEEAREKRDKSMNNYSANYDTRMNEKNKYKQERKGSAADYAMVKPGDIYYSSWGYDQTNIDFYQIISVKGAYAMIREIKSRQLPDENGNSMAAYVVPVKDSFTSDPEFKKKIQFNTFRTSDHSKTPYFHILHGQYASPWNRDKIYSSWYA